MKITLLVLLWLFAALQILDCISTYKAIKNGTGSEGNPIVRFFIDKLGLVGGLAFVTGLALVFIAWYLHSDPAGSVAEVVAFSVLDILYLKTVISNFKIARS